MRAWTSRVAAVIRSYALRFFFMIFLFSGPVSLAQSHEPSGVESASKLVIAMPESFRPYTYYHNQQWSGIDVEIARALYDRLEVDVEFQSMPWTRQLQQAEAGNIQGILTVYCNDERDFLHIVRPALYSVDISLFERAGQMPATGSLEDLRSGAVIGVVRENYFTDFLDTEDSHTLSLARETPLLLNQLLAGRIDYALEESFPIFSYARENGASAKIRRVGVLKQDEVCVAFSKPGLNRGTEFLERVSATIDQLKQDGTVNNVLERYLQ